MIIIEIENAAEVAARESFWARAFGGWAPALVERKVEERVVESLREVFAERGIRLRITVTDGSVAVAGPASAAVLPARKDGEPWKS